MRRGICTTKGEIPRTGELPGPIFSSRGQWQERAFAHMVSLAPPALFEVLDRETDPCTGKPGCNHGR